MGMPIMAGADCQSFDLDCRRRPSRHVAGASATGSRRHGRRLPGQFAARSASYKPCLKLGVDRCWRHWRLLPR